MQASQGALYQSNNGQASFGIAGAVQSRTVPANASSTGAASSTSNTSASTGEPQQGHFIYSPSTMQHVNSPVSTVVQAPVKDKQMHTHAMTGAPPSSGPCTVSATIARLTAEPQATMSPAAVSPAAMGQAAMGQAAMPSATKPPAAPKTIVRLTSRLRPTPSVSAQPSVSSDLQSVKSHSTDGAQVSNVTPNQTGVTSNAEGAAGKNIAKLTKSSGQNVGSDDGDDESYVPYVARKKHGPRGPYMTKKRKAEKKANERAAAEKAAAAQSLQVADTPAPLAASPAASAGSLSAKGIARKDALRLPLR